MRLWHILQARLRSLFLRSRREADLREELQQHIERETERLYERGLPLEAARLQAMRTFGGVEQIKEACRDARGTGAVDALFRDARHARRRLARDWRFTTAAILILGLGIGANTAIFSVVNAVLFRGQVFSEDRLVEIYQNASEGGGVGASSYPAYLDMAEYTDVFAITTAVLVPSGVTYRDGGVVRSALVEYTTATYLSTLGLRPSLGRWFEPAEDRRSAPIVAVIGHQAWTRKFGSDPSVIGRTIWIQGVPVTIVGVGPEGHHATLNVGIVIDFWLLIPAIPALGGPPRALERRPEEAGFFVKARLRDGVTVAQAQVAMNNLGARLATEYPEEDPGKGITVMAASDVRVHPEMDALLVPAAAVLLAIVGMVLAIACSNLATLLLVRGAARAKEVSVRLAMGATRGQLVRHLLTESLLLSLAGGIAGCILAWWAIRTLAALNLPVVMELSLDYRVLTFAITLALITGMTFGLAPALKATKIELLPTLRDDGEVRSAEHRRFSLKSALVVFQVAVSVVLLAGTTLLLQMLIAARSQRVGFAVEGVAMVETDSRYAGYSPADAGVVLEDLRRRVAAIPGVESAVLTRGLPMQTTGVLLAIDGAGPAPAGPLVVAGSIWAGPGYFDALRIPLLYGRAIDERDTRDTPRVAVVSESMARNHFGSVNAVGRRFRFELDPDSWMEVIGVARDTATADLAGDLVDPQPYLFYRSYTQLDRPATAVLARTSLDAGALVGSMQRELRAVNVALPVLSAKTMAKHLDQSLVAPRTGATLLAALGALGLLLASVGLYAVVAFAVARRSREIGIRMALGARSQQVVRTVARDVAVLVGVGTLLGLALSVLAILALRLVSIPTPGIEIYRPTVDPVALLAIAALMAVVGVAAAYMPARRAVRTDPLAALRHD